MPGVHIIIKGKVQGVFYRASAKEQADKLGLRGWIRNKEDGSVETKATGTQDQLNEWIEWCRNGPSGAIVSDMEINWINEEFHQGFDIKRGRN